VPTALAALRDDGTDAHRSDLLGVALGSHRDDRDDARIVETGDLLGTRRSSEAGHRDLLIDDQRQAVRGVGLVRQEVDAEGLVGADPDLGDRGTQLVQGHRRAGQDAQSPGR